MCQRLGRRKREQAYKRSEAYIEGPNVSLGHLLQMEGYRPGPKDFISSAASVVKRKGMIILREQADGKLDGEFIQ